KQFQGQYVLDLAGLKQTASAALPLLESYDETLPYALWLKNRMYYLDVADQLRLIIPSPEPKPGRPPSSAPAPRPAQEREIWITRLAKRSYPENARPYVSKLKSIFSAEGVPSELVWIAEVESSFD